MEIEAFARKAAKDIKNQADLSGFTQMLTKITIETALNAELSDHLSHYKYGKSESCNDLYGNNSKQVIAEEGCLYIETPHDRHGSSEPKLIKKRHKHLTSYEHEIKGLASGPSGQKCEEKNT